MIAQYDRIGINYSQLRKPDRRIAAAIHEALGSADTVLNVGAGNGSYEPTDREVIAVEPSLAMIRQRSASATAAVVRASAERLPFADRVFGASMAILTIHHWPKQRDGLREMRRVTRGGIVLLTFDPSHRPWLTDYLPALSALDETQMPAIADYGRWLGGRVSVVPLLVPHDCTDGFLYAYWRRPQAYLDARVRSGSSSFWALDNTEAGLQRLRHDLETGEWAKRYAELLTQSEYDAGYRLVLAA